MHPNEIRKTPEITPKTIILLWLIFFALLCFFITLNFDPLGKIAVDKETRAQSVAETNATKASITSNNTSILIYPDAPELGENHLVIPRLGIDAPISWEIINTPANTSQALEKGLAQIEGTALPGNTGNIYITGHSSDSAWKKGDYKEIFSTLDKIKKDDKIFLKYQNQVYVYQVLDQKIADANDASILAQGKEYELSLGTCWPVGTDKNRLIVRTKQIFPDPGKFTVE
jgi:sortase A